MPPSACFAKLFRHCPDGFSEGHTRKFLWLTSTIAGVFLVAAPTITNAQGTLLQDSILVDGQWRHYLLYKPDGLSIPAPTVFVLHGYGSNMYQMMLYSQMNQVADTGKFLVVYPQGTTDPNGKRYWNAGFSPLGARDTLFLNRLIQHLTDSLGIADRNRIYMCGMSNGGIMTYYMACFAGRYLAAIGSVAGSMIARWYQSCAPDHPIPLIHFHGTSDMYVPYEGGTTQWPVTFIAVDTIIAQWLTYLPVLTPPDSIHIDQYNDGTAIDWFRWFETSQTRSSLEFFRIEGGGHTWPGAIPIPSLGTTTREIHASIELWRFFQQHRQHTQWSATPPMPQSDKPQRHAALLLLHEPLRLSEPAVLYDVTGKCLRTLPAGTVLNPQDLIAGIYWLWLETTGQWQMIIVEQ